MRLIQDQGITKLVAAEIKAGFSSVKCVQYSGQERNYDASLNEYANNISCLVATTLARASAASFGLIRVSPLQYCFAYPSGYPQ